MATNVTVERVESERDLMTFITFPWQVYQGDPYWVPPLVFERRDFFDRRKNPFFQHGEVDYFLARRNGLPAGTIAAILNHAHNEVHGEKAACFGAFEMLDDYNVATALLETACNWARQRGLTIIRGPMTFSTNDEVGLLVDGFNSAPVVFMTYNPPYYRDFLERYGFTKAMDMFAYWIDDTVFGATEKSFPPRLMRIIEKVRAKGEFTIRRPRKADFPQELVRVKKAYNSAWERNWGFVPITDAEVDRMAEGMLQILDWDIVFLAETKDGELAGFALPLPDVNQALLKAYPGPSLLSSYLALPKFLWYKRQVDVMRVFALGVVPQYRNSGVDALLYYEVGSAGFAHGYRHAEMSWILENNAMMNRAIQFFGGKVYKTYRAYEKGL